MAWIPSAPLNIGHEIFANATFYIVIHIMGDNNILLAIVQQPLLQFFCSLADNELETPWKRGIDANERRRNVKRARFLQQQLFGSLYECSKKSIFTGIWTAAFARYRHGDITKDSWEVSVQAQLTYHCVHIVNMCVT